MATKRELQDSCVDAAEQFLETYDVQERLADWEVTDDFPVAAIDAGADERFQTRFTVGSATDSEPLSFSTVGSTADFAVWLDTGHSYDEFADGVFATDADDPVRHPLMVAEVVGEDHTQQHFPSTSEQTFDEAEAPYACRTKLPSFWHRIASSYRSVGLVFISDFEVELLPSHTHPAIVQSDNGLSESDVREAIQLWLAEVLFKLSDREFDVMDDV